MKRLIAAALLSLLVLAGCASDEPEEQAQEEQEAPTSVTLRAGVNDEEDPTIAILEFLPEKISVVSGASVTWEFPGTEPHSVTFLPEGQTPPPPGSDPALNQGNEAAGPVDGETLINSGLRPAGPGAAEPFEVSFDEPGTYSYVCVIHPLMVGEVTVGDEGDADTQEEIDERADEELGRWLEEGREAKEKLESAPVASTQQGGRTVWTVEMGATTEHTDILAFAPADSDIKAGDQVRFINNSGAPHTASFAMNAQLPQNPESPEATNPAPGPSPQTLRRTGYFNTGWLPPNAPPGAGPPEAARTYVFTVPEAGDYNYVCLLHAPSRMQGTLKVT